MRGVAVVVHVGSGVGLEEEDDDECERSDDKHSRGDVMQENKAHDGGPCGGDIFCVLARVRGNCEASGTFRRSGGGVLGVE